MNMQSYLQALHNNIAAWEGVAHYPHQFGGTEFALGKVEIGHYHRNGMVDIPFTKAIRRQLVDEGRAMLHHLLQDSGWITFFVRNADDIDNATWLFRLSYLQKRIARNRRDAQRLQSLINDVRELDLSPELHAILLPQLR